jgi:hypothetical protein
VCRYINLEYDLGIRKKGPFTTYDYSEEEYRKVKEFLSGTVRETLEKLKMQMQG